MANDQEDALPEKLAHRTRVDFKLSAQETAGILDDMLCEVQIELKRIGEAGKKTTSHFLAVALIAETQSLLEGIEHGKVVRGISRAASNAIKAVEILEQAGPDYDTALWYLLNVIPCLSQHGITIDGHPLSDNKHVDRVKS